MTLTGLTSTLPEHPIVHHEFERHAATTPDAVAVTCGSLVRTYGELNARANQLAHHMNLMGIGRGSVVGLCLDRTPILIESILATLKLGAAYVPLDTTYPTNRLRMNIAQLPAMALIIASDDADALLGTDRPRTLQLSDEQRPPEIDAAPTSNLNFGVAPDDLCYVVFTSGSTGTPKAVAVQHRGWYNLLNWLLIDYRLDAQSANLVVSSFGFDITQRSIMMPLFCGAPLHLLPSRSFDPAMAYRLIDELAISTLHCTPSTLYLLVDRETQRGGNALTRLDYIFIGGEALSVGRVAEWAQRPDNGCTLLHQYGVSECTDVATSYAMRDYPAYLAGITPVGKPVYNTTIHLLDEDLRDVAPGETGEVCISGISVGSGYLNATPAAAAKFTTITRKGESIRVYRTGDRGLVTPGGYLVIVGRMDAQVKIRGSRIDLGDVDQAVRRSSEIRDAAVVAVHNPDGELELVAFVIPTADVFDVQALRMQLLSTVPKSMVPSEFIVVPAFPLNPNGKVDRLALAANAVPVRA